MPDPIDLSKAPVEPTDPSEAPVEAGRPTSAFEGLPRLRWFLLALIGGPAWVALGRGVGSSEGDFTDVLIAAAPLLGLWMFTGGKTLRPLAELAWDGPREAALTMFLKPRRYGWSWLAAVLVYVAGPWPSVSDQLPVPGSTAMTATAGVLAFVFLTLPEKKQGPWASPLGVVLGRGPDYLPAGTRAAVLAGFALVGLGLAAAAGAFGRGPAELDALKGVLIVWSTMSISGLDAFKAPNELRPENPAPAA